MAGLARPSLFAAAADHRVDPRVKPGDDLSHTNPARIFVIVGCVKNTCNFLLISKVLLDVHSNIKLIYPDSFNRKLCGIFKGD
jgi:hypothetical protein